MRKSHLNVARALLAVLALSGITASAAAQSLADVAKQAQAQRQALARPSKVLTNADIKPDPLSVPPSLLRNATPPVQVSEPPRADPPVETSRRSDACTDCDRDGNSRTTERGASARRDSPRAGGLPNGRPDGTINHVNPSQAERVRIPPTSNGTRPLRQVCGVNTPREQAMANYMRAAGYPASNCP